MWSAPGGKEQEEEVNVSWKIGGMKRRGRKENDEEDKEEEKVQG